MNIPTGNREIQRAHRRNQEIIVQQARSRGLTGQLWAVLLQPGLFFRTLPTIDSTRQWLWVGLLVLALVGLSAVQAGSLGQTTGPDAGGIPPMQGDMGGAGPGFDFGGPPPGVVPGGPPTSGAADGAGISSNWTTALIAASGMLVGWLIQALLLCEVTLFRGFAPRLGQNFQIAIWASVPLGLMAVIQMIYYAAGGVPGAPGLSGLAIEMPGFADFAPLAQALLIALASQITLFGVWSMILLYLGARQALRGHWLTSLVVIVAWVLLLVIAPVVAGTVEVPVADAPPSMGEEMPPGMMPEPMPGEITRPIDAPPRPDIVDEVISEPGE